MDMTLIFIGGAVLLLLVMGLVLFNSPDAKAQSRRLKELSDRHGTSAGQIEKHMRRVMVSSDKKIGLFDRFVPKPELIQKRLSQTGKSWDLGQYSAACAGILVVGWLLAWFLGAPFLLAILLGVLLGLGLPHVAVGFLIKRRVAKFTTRFPDAIELLVRGLRSGLPITETIGVVGAELPEPCGTEFQTVADRIKIGRSMEDALQESADRLGTPEFQFFCVTLAIQRETGGNLAETLSNLSEVLRKRAQMKLKIAAMSSESKASAYIIGCLPFVVFGLIYNINANYMGKFFEDERLIMLGVGGICWMGIGAFVMSKMISFEI